MSLREEDQPERLRRALDELAHADAAEVVGQARMKARTEVSDRLAQSLARRLLAAAEARLLADFPDVRDQDPTDRTCDPSRAANTSAGDAANPGPDGREPDGEPRDGDEDPPIVGAAQGGRVMDSVPAAGAEADPSPGAFVDTASQGWYVYGVAGVRLQPERIAGIDPDHEVCVIDCSGVSALASLVPLAEFGEEALQAHLEDLAWLEDKARRHEHILDRLREHTTLVPMRLCTIYRTRASVRGMLARERDFLLDALDRLDGATEWGIKIFAAREGIDLGELESSDALDVSGRLDRAGPGEGYLLRRRLERLREEELQTLLDRCCEATHTKLAAVSREAKLNPLQPRELTGREDEMIFNGVYLVRDGAAAEFGGVVSALQQEYGARGLDLELTGPWPPYNFVNNPEAMGR